MTSIAYSPVSIQASPHSFPSVPDWFGEVTLLVHYLHRQGVLAAIEEQVRFARRRFGRYEVIDFVAVLFGYAVSGERTLEAFYERIDPWASAFMALFGRDRLPARATLSRFLASLDQAAVEALRILFLQDLLARPLVKEEQPAGLWDRQGNHFLVFDIDGTREAARQRALPRTQDRPTPKRRLRPLCAPGYTGRKRGEVVRTRTTVLQAHTHQWLATFGNPGNGEYRTELRRAVATIRGYLKAHHHPEERALLRLDGQYGTGAVLADLAGLAYVMRGKDYQFLDRAEVQARLHLPPDQQFSRPESQLVRTLYDCPGVAIGSSGLQCRQWNGSATAKPRQVSVLLHPLIVGSAPLFWRDWSRREHRRACMQFVRHQHIAVSLPPPAASPGKAEVILSGAQRAHSRLSWAERLARNARVPTASQVTIRLFGVPEGFALSLGLATA